MRMKSSWFFALALGLVQASGWCEEKPTLPRGHVFFETDFEGADALKGWTGEGKLGSGCESQSAIVIERTAQSSGSATYARMALPVEKMRGYEVYVSANVRGENVSEKPKPYNGVKFMLPAVVPQGRAYPEARTEAGTFDWKKVTFPARVPEDATELWAQVGLEAVTGKAWFDNIRITVRKPPFVPGPPVVKGPVYRGHGLPRLRGVQVSAQIGEDELRLLSQEWNVNVIRWWLIRLRAQVAGVDLLDLDLYDKWLDGELKKLDAALPLCEKYGLCVVVDLHSPPGGGLAPGGYTGSGESLFTNAACQKKFIAVWERIARRYRNSKAIWGYDLANEPIEREAAEDRMDWEELATNAAKAIRAIDPDRAIILEPAGGFSPSGLLRFKPIDVPNVVYSVHMYQPSAFTHQGTLEQRAKQPWVKKYVYPGEVEGKLWDKAALEAALKPAIDFQKRYGKHIFIGEFSAVRWAPDNSAYRYLQDLIEIFEEHEWDWTYFIFRTGWNGMSVEHGPDKEDRKPAAQPTDRQKLLCEWFAKNRKPSWYQGP